MSDEVFKKVTLDNLKAAVAKEHSVSSDCISIACLETSLGSKKGDGFSTDIVAADFEAHINGETFKKNYIYKMCPDDMRKDIFQKCNFMLRESLAYTWLMPEMNILRRKHGLREISFPKCFYASPEDGILIFENIKKAGFKTVQKKTEPLTMAEIKVVLERLASLHATSYYFVKTYPGGLEALKQEHEVIFNWSMFDIEKQDDAMKEKFYQMLSSIIVSSVKTLEAVGENDYASRLEAYYPNALKKWSTQFIPDDNIRVVIHGDAWYNNFMFKNKEGGDLEVYLHDLQGTCYQRPGLELAYFFISSVSFQQRESHLQTLLQFYYDNFFHNLKALDPTSINFFTFDELIKEFEAGFGYGFLIGFMHAQILLIKEDSPSEFKMAEVLDEEKAQEMYQKMAQHQIQCAISSPDYKDVLIGMMKDAIKRGLL